MNPNKDSKLGTISGPKLDPSAQVEPYIVFMLADSFVSFLPPEPNQQRYPIAEDTAVQSAPSEMQWCCGRRVDGFRLFRKLFKGPVCKI